MKIGFISATKGKLKNTDAAARDFYAVSSQFRYALSYCEQNYEETYILSIGSLHLIHPDSDLVGIDTDLQYLSKWDKKHWIRSISNEMREFFPLGTELYFHTSNWYNLLFQWLEPDYPIHKPLKGLSIGKQLQYYKQQVGQLPSVKNEEATWN